MLRGHLIDRQGAPRPYNVDAAMNLAALEQRHGHPGEVVIEHALVEAAEEIGVAQAVAARPRLAQNSVEALGIARQPVLRIARVPQPRDDPPPLLIRTEGEIPPANRPHHPIHSIADPPRIETKRAHRATGL